MKFGRKVVAERWGQQKTAFLSQVYPISFPAWRYPCDQWSHK